MSDFMGIKVLIVDNNSFIAKTLYSILDAFGIRTILMSSSLEEAEKMFYNKRIDVVFVDFMMEKRSGINFIKNVRNSKTDKNGSDVPIILDTGMTDIDTITLARDAGVTEVIGKPFSPDQVFQKLYNALYNKRDFIDVDEYVGPTRRRRKVNKAEWGVENERRGSAASETSDD
jgi:two-component system, chemotaxis family, chemotaxis protein CheY